MRSPRERAVLIAIVTVIALVLRVAYVHQTIVIDPLRDDAGQYDRYATNLCEHGVFSSSSGDRPAPDSLRGPGYPAFLAVLRTLCGSHYHGVALYLQALLTALLVPLTYWLSRRFLPFWASVTTSSLVALSPHLVSMSGYLLSESLLALVLLAALCVHLAAVRRPHPATLAAAGVLFGCAALIHESTTLLLPGLIALELFRRRRTDPPVERPGRLGIALCAFLLVVGAWSVRNAVSVSDPARSGARRALATASHGAYPDFVHERPGYRYYPYREDPAQPAFGSSLTGFCSVLSDRVAERPVRYLSWYLLEKPYWLWSWNVLQGEGDVYVYPVHKSLYLDNAAANSTRALMYWLHPATLLLLLCGCALCAWRTLRTLRSRAPIPPEVFCLVGAVVYFTGIGIAFAPWPRYSIPLRPEMYMVAVWALHEIAGSVRRQRAASPGTGLAAEPATHAAP